PGLLEALGPELLREELARARELARLELARRLPRRLAERVRGGEPEHGAVERAALVLEVAQGLEAPADPDLGVETDEDRERLREVSARRGPVAELRARARGPGARRPRSARGRARARGRAPPGGGGARGPARRPSRGSSPG